MVGAKNRFQIVVRTKEEICEDYLNYLISKGVISPSEQKYFLDNLNEVYEALLSKLYETEKIEGGYVSTKEAFWTFCNFVIKEDISTGRPVWNRLVEEIFEITERNKFFAIQAARGHGKSYFYSGLYLPFKHFLIPGFNSLVMVGVPKMALDLVRNFKRAVESNELLLEKKETHLGKYLLWTNRDLQYNGGTFETITVGTTPRGKHVNFALADDLLREDDKYSNEAIKTIFLGGLTPVIGTKKGRLGLIGTPKSYEDIFHELMKGKDGELIRDGRLSARNFYSKCFPAIVDEKKRKLLLPEVWTYEQLMAIKQSVGEINFEREYMLNCITEDTAMFSRRLINSCVDKEVKWEERGEVDSTYVIGVDVALSSAARADYSVFTILKLEDSQKGTTKKVVHIFREKGVDPDSQVEELERLAKSFNDAFVMVEINSFGENLFLELQKKGVNVSSFRTDKYKKENIIRYLINEMKSGHILFSGDDVEELKNLKEELRNFGVKKTARGTFKLESLSGKDDAVMSLAIANYAANDLVGGIAEPATVLMNVHNRKGIYAHKPASVGVATNEPKPIDPRNPTFWFD